LHAGGGARLQKFLTAAFVLLRIQLKQHPLRLHPVRLPVFLLSCHSITKKKKTKQKFKQRAERILQQFKGA
jgi:hypothetical protein